MVNSMITFIFSLEWYIVKLYLYLVGMDYSTIIFILILELYMV